MSLCLSSFLQAFFPAKKASGESPARRDTPQNSEPDHSSNYVYNSIGELIENKQEDRGYEYNSAGLVTRVYQLSNNHTISSFTYNDKGLRHSKTTYALGIAAEDTYYSYDAGGAQVATYTRDLQSKTPTTDLQNHTLYAAGRVGLLDVSTGKALFELSDHLGNVRAVVTASANGAAETVSYTDYYSHGGVLPGRNYTSSLSFPYGYQGQEKDAATGLTNFELRQYDPRIGRWYNPDPNMQHHSPYLAMSNNPVSFTDPDGGFDGDDGYNNAMPGIVDRNKNDFAAQSFAASGKIFDWMNASPTDRAMMQKFYGTSYGWQEGNRILDNAALGGYKLKDGSVYTFENNQLSRTHIEKILKEGVATWSSIMLDVAITEILTTLGEISVIQYLGYEKTDTKLTPTVEFKFTPKNPENIEDANWVQTISSNQSNQEAETQIYIKGSSDMPYQIVDGPQHNGHGHDYLPDEPRFFYKDNETEFRSSKFNGFDIFHDTPTRSSRPQNVVYFKAELSLLVKYKDSPTYKVYKTISWGFKMMPKGGGFMTPLRIIEPSQFQLNAIPVPYIK